jgi:hypothetical protein
VMKVIPFTAPRPGRRAPSMSTCDRLDAQRAGRTDAQAS